MQICSHIWPVYIQRMSVHCANSCIHVFDEGRRTVAMLSSETGYLNDNITAVFEQTHDGFYILLIICVYTNVYII